MGTSNEHVRTFIISRSVFLRMRTAWDRSCRQNQSTHIMFSNLFPKIVPCMRYRGKIWFSRTGNIWQYFIIQTIIIIKIDDNIIRQMHFAWWITKVTDTHSENKILIAFPRQQWLRERVCMLRLNVHCLSCIKMVAFAMLTWVPLNT